MFGHSGLESVKSTDGRSPSSFRHEGPMHLPISSRTCLFPVVTFLTISSLVLAGCSGGSNAAAVFTAPGPPAVVSISLSPSAVMPGQSATLTWSSQNATACNGSGTWSGSQPTSGSMTVLLQGTTTQSYTLICTGTGRAGQNTALLAESPQAGACTAGPAITARHGKRSMQRHPPHGSAS